MSAADRWREQLEAWAIPPEILTQAPEDPWGFPVAAFSGDIGSGAAELSLSHRRALEALPEGGTVLDVGAGGGAMSRPLRARAGRVVAVDSQDSMLARVDADELVHGHWPDVAASVEKADVVVCGHVFYNAPDLAGFVAALDDHSRCRVVTEMTDAHPLTATVGLWRRFWGIERPSGPTWKDAVAVVREGGIEPEVETYEGRSGFLGFPTLDDLVAFQRRRLCLPSGRDTELRQVLLDEGARERDGRWVASAQPRRLVTLWWDRRPGRVSPGGAPSRGR